MNDFISFKHLLESITIQNAIDLSNLVKGFKKINDETLSTQDSKAVESLNLKLTKWGYKSKKIDRHDTIWTKGKSKVNISWNSSETKATIVVYND